MISFDYSSYGDDKNKIRIKDTKDTKDTKCTRDTQTCITYFAGYKVFLNFPEKR